MSVSVESVIDMKRIPTTCRWRAVFFSHVTISNNNYITPFNPCYWTKGFKILYCFVCRWYYRVFYLILWNQYQILFNLAICLVSELTILIWFDPVKKWRTSIANPFMKNTTSVWYEVHRCLGDYPVLFCFSRILDNDHFSPVKNDVGFKIWFCKGIVTHIVQYLYKDNNLMLFDKLKANYDVPQKHFFKYL